MNQTIKVLNFSTHNEDCGIGKYHEMFVEALAAYPQLQTTFFETSPNQLKRMTPSQQKDIYNKLATKLREYDVLHVQHEFGFYFTDEFVQVCQVAKQIGKKLMITYHTSPDVAIKDAKLQGLGPRSYIHYLRQRRYRQRMIRNHITPAVTADTVIVHNSLTQQALEYLGVPSSSIKRLSLPVPIVKTYDEVSTEIGTALHKKSGDVIFCTVGFMHRFKGLKDAIKALNYLPPNYKLAIIGGNHPESDEVQIYNDLADLIIKYGLSERVYITGFIKDDDRLNRLIRECDLCIYPYDGVYYARVSSAALNLAFSNHLSVIAYPVATFREINDQFDAMLLTNGFSYYELARAIKQTNLQDLAKKSVVYAAKNSYAHVTKDLLAMYQEV